MAAERVLDARLRARGHVNEELVREVRVAIAAPLDLREHGHALIGTLVRATLIGDVRVVVVDRVAVNVYFADQEPRMDAELVDNPRLTPRGKIGPIVPLRPG